MSEFIWWAWNERPSHERILKVFNTIRQQPCRYCPGQYCTRHESAAILVHKRSGCLYGKRAPEWPSISDSQLGGNVLEWFTLYLSSLRPRNLGWLRRVDADPRLQVPSCFAVLGQLCSIRRSVSPAVLQSLVVSLVLSRLDYGNAMLAGLPGTSSTDCRRWSMVQHDLFAMHESTST